jgi:hypothetical protein
MKGNWDFVWRSVAWTVGGSIVTYAGLMGVYLGVYQGMALYCRLANQRAE